MARVHERISNARQDFLHKLSRKIVNDNQVVVVENLNIKGMLRLRSLAKAISAEGIRMLSVLGTRTAAEGGDVRPSMWT